MSKDYRTAMAYRDTRHIKVLVPDWFDDTILLDTRDLSTNTYEWEHPEMIERRPNSTTLQQNGVTHPKRVTPSQPQMEIKDVWSGRRILLSTSLVLTGFRRRILDDWILKCRGVPIQYISNGGLGHGQDYRYAQLAAGYASHWSHLRPKRSDPALPPGTVKDFDKHKIAITNYTGEAREYLKKLIAVMGGEFTAHLNIQNTVLVAAQYNLTPAHPDYTSYPPGVDLGVKVGERSVGHDIEEIVDTEAMRLGSFYW
ncbi:hypothetical protein B0H13DRAFT_2284842 [Mycena leptocephala]|nr:hypothetical protein B0H13DRAFT_2284842 [Mycena leptocephala]